MQIAKIVTIVKIPFATAETGKNKMTGNHALILRNDFENDKILYRTGPGPTKNGKSRTSPSPTVRGSMITHTWNQVSALNNFKVKNSARL